MSFDSAVRRSPARAPLRSAVVGMAFAIATASCGDVLGDVRLETVSPDGLGGERSIDQVAASLQPCDAAAREAGIPCLDECTPGEVRCEGELLEECPASGRTFRVRDQCASAALCDAVSGACRPAACGLDQYQCTDDGALLRCNDDRTEFELVDQCLSGAFCSARRGREGCELAPCEPGALRCNGARIERCRSDRRGFEPYGERCASAELCVEEAGGARCRDEVCEAGHFRCQGERLERCNDARTAYVTVTTCESEALCNAGTRSCEVPTCSLDEQRCEGGVLERCHGNPMTFRIVEDCGSAALCDPQQPRCLEPTTEPPTNEPPTTEPPTTEPPTTEPPTTEPPTTPPPPPDLGTGPYQFEAASGPPALGLGPLTLEHPTAWADVQTTPWVDAAGQVIGPRYVASTDASRFTRFYDIPGVVFAARPAMPGGISALRELVAPELLAFCPTRAPQPAAYDDGLYVGLTDRYEGCGATGATTHVVVAEPEGGAFLVLVIVTVVANRDDVARQEVWDTFIVRTD